MNVLDVIRGWARRWYITVPGLIAAIVASVLMWQTTPSEYTRYGSLLLFPGEGLLPEDSTSNQFLYIGGLAPVADVLVRAMNGDSELEQLAEEYGDAEVLITRDSTATGPVVLVSVTTRSDELTGPLLDAAIELTGERLERLQVEQGIISRDRVDITTIVTEQESTVGVRDRLLLTALAGLGISLITLAGASLLDGLLVRTRRRSGKEPRDRKRRRPAREQATSEASDDVDESTEPRGGTVERASSARMDETIAEDMAAAGSRVG